MRLRRTASGLALVLGITAVLSACDGSEDTRSPTAGETSSSAPEREPEAGQPGEGESAEALSGPCDLLEPADYARFIPKAVRKVMYESPELDRSLGSFKTCHVRAGLISYLSFGYTSEPQSWQTTRANTKNDRIKDSSLGDEVDEGLSDIRVDVPGIGDGAFVYRTLTTLDAYAVSGDVVFNVSPGLGTEMKDASELATLLQYAVIKADAGVDTSPVQIPTLCPDPAGAEVMKVIGDVSHAYGTAFEGVPPTCDYRSADGTVLSAHGRILPKATFQREYDSDLLDTETLDPGPGVKIELYRDPSDGEFTLFAYYPKQNILVEVSTSRTAWGAKKVSGDRASLVAFANAYLKANAPRR